MFRLAAVIIVFCWGLLAPILAWAAEGDVSNGVEIVPSGHDFGSLEVGDTAVLDFQVVNSTSSRIRVSGVGLEGNGPFRITRESCTGNLRTSCSVTVSFLPEAEGDWSVDLVITTRNFSRRVPISGAAVARPNAPDLSPPSGEPVLGISLNPIDFGPVLVTALQERPIILRNEGTAPLEIGEIGSSDPLAPPFLLAEDGCSNRQLPPGARCRVVVRFSPLTTGVQSDRLDIPTAIGGSARVTLRGEGVSTPLPAIYVEDRLGLEEDLSLPFAAVLVGRDSETVVRVQNLGTADLSLLSLGETDPLQPPFLMRANDCSERILPPGGECFFRVQFRPKEEGDFSDSFELASDDPRFPELVLRASGSGAVVPGNLPPAAPQLIHPDPDQVNLRDVVNFRWGRCDDPDADPVGYQLYLSTDPDFSDVDPRPVQLPPAALLGAGGAGFGLVAWVFLRGRRRTAVVILLVLLALLSACGEDIEDNATVEVGSLQDRTTYYWKVTSDDGRGGITDSEIRSFTTR